MASANRFTDTKEKFGNTCPADKEGQCLDARTFIVSWQVLPISIDRRTWWLDALEDPSIGFTIVEDSTLPSGCRSQGIAAATDLEVMVGVSHEIPMKPQV